MVSKTDIVKYLTNQNDQKKISVVYSICISLKCNEFSELEGINTEFTLENRNRPTHTRHRTRILVRDADSVAAQDLDFGLLEFSLPVLPPTRN